MAKKIDSEKLSQIIRNTTNELVSRTESYSTKYPSAGADDNVNKDDVVVIQYNKNKVAIPKEEYAKIKDDNNAIIEAMNKEIKILVDEAKDLDPDVSDENNENK